MIQIQVITTLPAVDRAAEVAPVRQAQRVPMGRAMPAEPGMYLVLAAAVAAEQAPLVAMEKQIGAGRVDRVEGVTSRVHFKCMQAVAGELEKPHRVAAVVAELAAAAPEPPLALPEQTVWAVAAEGVGMLVLAATAAKAS